MDKKKKLIIIASVAMVALIAGIIGTGSLSSFGGLQSSAFNVQGKITNANQSLSTANTKLSQLKQQKQESESMMTTTNTTLQNTRITCLSYRSAISRIAQKVQDAEAVLKPLQESYNAKVSARDSLQNQLNANKKTIEDNSKIVIPGYQKEQKKFKSTTQEYKNLTAQIAAVKAENTRLGKLNTDPKTGLQKQITAINAEIKTMEKAGSPLKIAQTNVQSAKNTRPAQDETATCTTYDQAQSEKNRLSEQVTSIDTQISQTENEIQSLQSQIATLNAQFTDAKNQEDKAQAEAIAANAERQRALQDAAQAQQNQAQQNNTQTTAESSQTGNTNTATASNETPQSGGNEENNNPTTPTNPISPTNAELLKEANSVAEHKLGCTDFGAENYDPEADEDDGSCKFTAESRQKVCDELEERIAKNNQVVLDPLETVGNIEIAQEYIEADTNSLAQICE